LNIERGRTENTIVAIELNTCTLVSRLPSRHHRDMKAGMLPTKPVHILHVCLQYKQLASVYLPAHSTLSKAGRAMDSTCINAKGCLLIKIQRHAHACVIDDVDVP
jgi:hypothetical protein